MSTPIQLQCIPGGTRAQRIRRAAWAKRFRTSAVLLLLTLALAIVVAGLPFIAGAISAALLP